jgi:hypothetical protein
MEEISRKITWCDLLIVVGTSVSFSFQNYLILLIIRCNFLTVLDLTRGRYNLCFRSQIKEQDILHNFNYNSSRSR